MFAPTDEAFEKAFKPSELKALLKDKDRIGKVLRSHIIDGDHASNHLAAGKVKSLQGNEVEIKTEGKVTFEGGEVTKADVAATNGRIHIINKIYLPK